MEKTKTANFTKRIADWIKNTIGGASCPWWIFADKNSADKDLKSCFEIID